MVEQKAKLMKQLINLYEQYDSIKSNEIKRVVGEYIKQIEKELKGLL